MLQYIACIVMSPNDANEPVGPARRRAEAPAAPGRGFFAGNQCLDSRALWRLVRGCSVAAIGVAAAAIEGQAVVLAESADGVCVLEIRVRIRHPDNDRTEALVVLAAGRKHRGDQWVPFVVP